MSNGFFGMDVNGEKNPFFGRKHTDAFKLKVSGERHPMFNTNNYDIWVSKYGKDEADRRAQAQSKKLADAWKTGAMRDKLATTKATPEYKAKKTAASKEVLSRPGLIEKRSETFRATMLEKRKLKHPDWSEEDHIKREKDLLRKNNCRLKRKLCETSAQQFS